MRRYETIVIVDPDLSEEGRAPVLDKVAQLVPQFDGVMFQVDDWGARKLAYDIKKKSRGYYVRLDFCGSGALVSEIERHFRIDDRVLKFMTVLLDKDADPEKIMAEIAREEAARAERRQAEAEAADDAAAAAETEADPPVKAQATDTPEPEKAEENKAPETSEEA